MIDLWLSVMANFKSAAIREYQERLVRERKDQQRRIEVIVDGLEVSVFGALDGIDNVMAAANLSDAERVDPYVFRYVHTKLRLPRHSSFKLSLPEQALLVLSCRCPPAGQNRDSVPWEEAASQNCSGFGTPQKPPDPISFFAPQFHLLLQRRVPCPYPSLAQVLVEIPPVSCY
jgi:hypothetical protein